MSLAQRFSKGVLQAGLGQLGQQALILLRNIFVARLLPPEQFGIALTLTTVVAAVDAMTEFGIELFLVRTRKDDDEGLQATLHSLLIARGAVVALVIFLAAPFIARLFDAPDMTWLYRMLALVPLIRSFAHLDVRRFERDMIYWPGVWVTFVSIASGTVVAIALAYVLRDSRAVLYGTLVQVAMLALLTHLASVRPYALRLKSDHVRHLITFGMPLIINGLLLLMIAQGDRMVIGAMLGLEELAAYGAVSILTLGITGLVMRVSGQLYLPLLSGIETHSDAYVRRFDMCGALSVTIALCGLAGFVTIGELVVNRAFGDHYASLGTIATWLGFQSACRIFRSWPQIGQLARGTTAELLKSNAMSALGFPVAVGALWLGWGLPAVAISYAAAEFLALSYAMLTEPHARRSGGPRLYLLFIVLSVALVAIGLSPFGRLPLATAIPLLLLCWAIIITVVLVALPSVRATALQEWRKIRHKMPTVRENTPP